jgi:hypothetical protein
MTALFEVMPGHSFSRAHWSMAATPGPDAVELKELRPRLRIDVTHLFDVFSANPRWSYTNRAERTWAAHVKPHADASATTSVTKK